jgi:two-component system cell cycle response regulator
MKGLKNPDRDDGKKQSGGHGKGDSIKVLLVEDNPGDARLIEEMLTAAEYALFEVVREDRLTTGLERVSTGGFDVVLLDLLLPDSRNLDSLRSFIKKAPGLPILVLTGLHDESLAVEAVRKGAEDYLIKGQMDSDLLARAVSFAIERKRIMEELKNTTLDLRTTIYELRKSNQKVLEQQKSVIEEERLKVLLQIAGATAHEINQPLTALLGNIEMIKSGKNIPSDLSDFLLEIELAGRKIADIVSRVQDLHNLDSKPYIGDTSIINFDREINILSVEDSDSDFKKINRILDGIDNVILKRAKGVSDALASIEKEPPDIVFLDYYMKDGNGVDFLRKMRDTQREIPTIVITGNGNEMIASRVIQEGAFDYFPVDIVGEKSLLRSIANTLEKARLKREIKQAQDKLAQMSIRDELTGLYNRRFFLEALGKEIARANRFKTEFILCLLDLDHFKKINDTHGHPAGDLVLADVGRMLNKLIRINDLPCRYGGEEFVIILPETRLEEAKNVCERFREQVSDHDFRLGSSSIRVTISAGIAMYNGYFSKNAEDIISEADQALYKSKRNGRNRVSEFGD